ncbi:MAG TPA: efflux RND transporter periplasmic adaptor subunit [Candidatus Acidoferrum sp.]|nr:efflux RND transporter periplasmic adaptor subunit [Candidatus Acidoferrum sp.]
MNFKNQSLAAALLLSASLGAGLTGCSGDRRSEATQSEAVGGVAVIVAQQQNIPDWLEEVGTVRAAQTSHVASQIMGNIVEIMAHEGDRVSKGQILATIDDAQPRAAMAQAAAAVTAAEKDVTAADSDFALAQTTLKRYQELYGKKSVSPQEFDEVKARNQATEARRDIARAGQAQASAALAQARTSLSYTQIRAPFNGVVTEKRADAGTLVSPGMPIFTVEDTHGYRLEATVDESDIYIVHTGETVPVSVDALGGSDVSGKVEQIVPAADPASRSFLVKIGLPASERLRSGLFGRARFARGERSALLIPQSAVVERGQLQGVYVTDASGVAELRYVTLGRTAGRQVEVLSGLQSGERLIAAPGEREFNGKRIAMQP